MEPYRIRAEDKTKRSIVYRINVDDRRKRIDEKALHRKRSSVDGALNSKFTTVWSKCRFWPIFENALEVFPVLFIQQKSESIRTNMYSHRKNGAINENRVEKTLRYCVPPEKVKAI